LSLEPVILRRGSDGDLAEVSRIQSASLQAAQWDVRDYLAYDFVVAVCCGRIAGFAVARRVAAGESELLNLAVDPEFRRRGIGRQLVTDLVSRYGGGFWLEVRELNLIARKFYEKLGFRVAGKRPGYYPDSGECGIVMNFHS
jgi:ribosomal protein S18 acetylase RimI-like enzyme